MADRDRTIPLDAATGCSGSAATPVSAGPAAEAPSTTPPAWRSAGGTADWIVANNLRERVLRESLRAMAALRDSLERASVPDSRVEAPRLEETKLLLAPFSRGGNRLLEALYPEQAFPRSTPWDSPGFLVTELLDAAAGRSPARREPEAILVDASAFRRSLLRPRPSPGGWPARRRRRISPCPRPPPPFWSSSPTRGTVPMPMRESLLKTIEAACGNAAADLSLTKRSSLPAFARAVFAKWGTPLSTDREHRPRASSSMIRGLGALRPWVFPGNHSRYPSGEASGSNGT